MSEQPRVERVRTATLEIACEVSGPDEGAPVILLHGFPDDPRPGTVSLRHWPARLPDDRPLSARLRSDPLPSRRQIRSGNKPPSGRIARPDGRAQDRGATLAGYDWGGRTA